MSPELILCGQSSKAADVWATGVVMYILLCGRPPFHSASNREVLERSAEGKIKLDGPDWSLVSNEAKDLLLKMLTVDPTKRATCEEVLQHPWLLLLDEDQSTKVVSVEAESVIEASQVSERASEMRSSQSQKALVKAAQVHPVSIGGRGVNLAGALRKLTGHVSHLRHEKITRAGSRFSHGVGRKASHSVTFDGSRQSSLAVRYLDNDQKEGENENLNMLFFNSTLRDALPLTLSALSRCADGSDMDSDVSIDEPKVSIEQFLVIMQSFHLGTNSSSILDNESSRSVSEASVVSTPMKDNASTPPPPPPLPSRPDSQTLSPTIANLALCRFLDRDGDGFISADDILGAQALVLQRSDQFMRIVFRIYIESLWYPGRQLNLVNHIKKAPLRANGADAWQRGWDPSTKDVNEGSQKHFQNNNLVLEIPHLDSVEAPRYITVRHTAALFQRLGYTSYAGTEVFRLLWEALQNQNKQRDETNNNNSADSADLQLSTNEERPSVASAATATAIPATPSDVDDKEKEKSGQPSSSGKSETGVTSMKIDFSDFCRAADIDDVLIQVLFRRARQKLSDLVKEAEQTYYKEQESLFEEKGGQEADNDNEDQPSMNQQTASSILASLIEADTGMAFRSLRKEEMAALHRKENFPGAHLLRSGVQSVLFGMQDSMSRSVKNIMEARAETRGNGEFSPGGSNDTAFKEA